MSPVSSRFPLFFRLLTLIFMTLILMIQLVAIESKISERQSLNESVQRDIGNSSAGEQRIEGPRLVIRFKVRQTLTTVDAKGRYQTHVEETPQQIVLETHALKIAGKASVETRHRGIYEARLYTLNSMVTGEFIVPRAYGTGFSVQEIIPGSAHLVLGLSDSRGIRNVPQLQWGSQSHEFLPGNLKTGTLPNGIHADVATLDAAEAHTLGFSFPLELLGMSSLGIIPSGDATHVSLTSPWPHPSFGGAFLPRTHSITNEGFSAEWLVGRLARNHASSEPSAENQPERPAEAFYVEFVDPVNIYLQSERAVKYGIMFIVLIFTAFFMFETLHNMRIHPLQYLLVGLAMAMFFLLLISLSEHMRFVSAYAISGAACAGLIGLYVAGVLRAARPALAFTSGIALLYAVLYGVLQSEDNALLMGSLVLFGALAAVMLLTRKMDWYSINTPK